MVATMKLRQSTKIALVVAALLASSPSFGQGQLWLNAGKAIYSVVLAGVVIFTTRSPAAAEKKKQENPGAEIRVKYGGPCPPGQDYDELGDECPHRGK